MIEVRTAHTAELDSDLLKAVRALVRDAFEGAFDDHDWEHALGGIHALSYDDGGELAGHASVVMRRLLHGGRALRCGYVEGVGVRADARRRGHGDALMGALERVIRGAYDLAGWGRPMTRSRCTSGAAGSAGSVRRRRLRRRASCGRRTRTVLFTRLRCTSRSTCRAS